MKAAGVRRPDQSTLAGVRVLVVTNITPDAASPSRGVFVRDQVAALAPGRGRGRALLLPPRPVELSPRGPADPPAAARGALRPGPRPLRAGRLVRVAGRGPAPDRHLPRHRRAPPDRRAVCRAAWRGGSTWSPGASRALFAPEAGRPGLPRRPGASAVLPCGADLDRFRPSPRAEARQRLGLDPDGRYLLFPAATFRPEKRHDRAARGRPPGGRGAAERRRDRGRADARLDQRRQRRAGHLGERGLRAGRRRGTGLRRAGALDPGRRRARRCCAGSMAASPSHSTRGDGRSSPASTSTRPTRGSPVAGAPAGSRPS